jgi:hypothetical protein
LTGYLVVRSQGGAILASGEVNQVANGDRVTVHVVLHFRDGSLDDETTIYSQHGNFQLISDRHIQHGPFFKKPSDLLVEADGQITSRSLDKDGKEHVDTEHVDLPPDVSNGLVIPVLSSMRPDSPDFKIGLVVPQGNKGRLIKLDITAIGKGSFSVAGRSHSAHIFRLKLELGGLVGAIAPIVGKQPSDITVWLSDGEVPSFVREVGQLSDGGPVISMELAGTTFARAAAAK